MARGRGEGSVRLRDDGKWEGRMYTGPEGGPRTRKSVYGASKKEVLDKMAAERLASGEAFNDSGEMLLRDFLTHWLDALKAKTETVPPKRSRKTYESYKYTVNKYLVPYLGARPLKSLKPSDMIYLEKAHKAAGVPEKSSLYTRILLKNAVRTAVFPSQLIEADPYSAVRFERPKVAERQTWTWEQAERVFSAAKAREDRLYLFYVIDVALGLRHSEALGLKLSDFNFEAGTLRVQRTIAEYFGYRSGTGHVEFVVSPTKTHSSNATIHVPAEILKLVREHQLRYGIKPDGWLFQTRKGTFYTQSNVLRAFRKSIEFTGLPIPKITIHDLRHTCATLLLEKGMDLKDIQYLLRHSNYTITANTYAHVKPKAAKGLADTMGKIMRSGGMT